MKKITLIATILLGTIAFANSQTNNNFVIGERVNFESEILNEERTILVYLPPTYNFSDSKYPVLYLLDGGFHFHHASGIVDFLASQGLMPQTIVVAIVNTDRNKDFTPTHLSQRPSSGGAEKFTHFFEEELFTFVERNYRSNSYKILMGHSLGGTFATYALLNKPELFNSYISISPYLMYDDNFMIRETEQKIKSKYSNVKYYMTVGNEPNYFEPLDHFAKTIETKKPKGLDFKYTKMLNDNHGSVPHLSIYNGLLFIFSGWKLDAETFNEGIIAIDKHYKKLSKEFSIQITTPENTINILGYNYLGKEDFDNAITVFKENVKRFPNSANVYDSLGEAYEKSGNTNLAKANYQMAVKLTQESNHPNLAIFKENLKRVSAE